MRLAHFSSVFPFSPLTGRGPKHNFDYSKCKPGQCVSARELYILPTKLLQPGLLLSFDQLHSSECRVLASPI
jgi:hypothetical protein